MDMLTMKINGKEVSVTPGSTILQAARENGIHIPTLCHFEGLPPHANCRMCIVEVEGMRTFQPACATKVSANMAVHTDTEAIRNARKSVLELILADHAVDCHHCLRIGSSKCDDLDPVFCEMCFWCDCPRDGFCELQTLAREYHVDVLPYAINADKYPVDSSLGSIIRNPNKCIKCRRCVDVCGEVQTVHNLSAMNRGTDIMIVPEMGKPMAESACVRCGRCASVCPTGAIYMAEHKDPLLYFTHAYDTDVVAQLSADVIPELTALYKLEDGTITLENICTALHKIGIHTVISDEHAKLLAAQKAAEIIQSNVGDEPVILTNSTAVVHFIDKYFPLMKEKIRTYDSAQTIFGEIAKEMKVQNTLKTVNITSVNEAGAEAEETHNVDYVLNARELYRTFLRTGGAPAKKRPTELDQKWDEDAFPYPELLGEKDWNLDPEPEELEITINGKTCICAVAHNLGQVRKLLEGDWQNYDVIRLMA